MRKPVLTSALLLSLLAGSAAAECTLPERPDSIDGTNATMEDMVTTQSAVKAFQAANGDYLACMEAQLTALEEQVAAGDAEAMAQAEQLNEAYNAAVAIEEQVAAGFNEAVRAFKAANP